jgi:superfamily II DNA or RNA helicase
MEKNDKSAMGETSSPKTADELQKLQEENSRLKALLKQHGISWDKEQIEDSRVQLPNDLPIHFSTDQKVTLFRRLFRGRVDIYPTRWKSAKGRSGYSPACGNEWKTGLCNKPKVKCADCDNRLFLPVTDQVIYDHLSGKHIVGVYPLLEDDTCYFLAVDFDKSEWKEDSRSFIQSCIELEIPAALEISRSGKGAHVWVFFYHPVPAREARQLGAALISYTCDKTRQLSLTSYDRFFPNQDIMPKGGFGNLIALPLQKKPRENGCSVFVDHDLTPYSDQWQYLSSLKPMSPSDLESALLRACDGKHPLDVAFLSEENDYKPWQRPLAAQNQISGSLPDELNLVVANQVFIAKNDLPQTLANRLIRIAAFQNPEFYKAQAMRLPVWDKPRIIGCAENFPHHIGLPSGCLEPVLELLAQNNVRAVIQNERVSGKKIKTKFTGQLRNDQKTSVRKMMKHDMGVLCAPTAFGKTVTAAAMIARRKVSTLILVHRTELLTQWKERMATFLDLPKGLPGALGGGKNKLSGEIDIAVMQSLSKREDIHEILDSYGQIIIDECHHISAFSFETILKQAKAKFILGLTATPVRRDGHHPIIFMQCGPIRHTAAQPKNLPTELEVWPQYIPAPSCPHDAEIQDVFKALVNDVKRTEKIARDIVNAYQEGRKVLVLTERTEHLSLLQTCLAEAVPTCYVLHGRLSKKQRAATFDSLSELDEKAPRVLLATGRFIGEGFDHPPLDTLVLAMPISWKGTLQQYAGRLHREHTEKKDVRIYDYIERDQPKLARMWDKRERGYRAMGYKICSQKLNQEGQKSD